MFLFTQDEQRGANYVYKKTDCNSMLNWAGKQNLALQCVPGESGLTQKYALQSALRIGESLFLDHGFFP